MANPVQFGRLLKEVRNAASPVQRMKVLARAWRTLQRLSPTERASLATEVGIDGAEEIVERMASRYGRLKPAVVLQALEKARGAEPQQLKDFFRGLRDPRRRGRMLQRGLEAITSDLAGQGPPAASPDAGVQPGPVAKPASLPATASAPPKTAVSDAAKAAGAAAGATLAAGAAASMAKADAPTTAPQRAEETKSPDREASPSRTPPKPEPVRVHRPGPANGPPRPRTSPAVARPPSPRPSRPPAPPVARRGERPHLFQAGVMQGLGANDLIGRVEAAGSLVRRLRVVRTHAGRARGLGVEALRRLLDLFESPWARRRALTALLEQRVPGDLGDALGLIDDLESRAARRWCLGTILDKWTLSEQVRDEIRARRRRPHDRILASPDPGAGGS